MSFDSGEFTPGDEVVHARTRREIEWRELPENPSNMTFRGRYDHVDTAVSALIDLKNLPSDTEIKVLDFAGGVVSFGSPTAHDLHDSITNAHLKPHITVVDRTIPENLNPSYPDVTYATELDNTDESFNIIRALHVVEHMDPAEYQKTREQLLTKLSDGWLFISLQNECTTQKEMVQTFIGRIQHL